MCDTLVALGNSTEDGSVLFAKNSDREPNEAQGLLYQPAQEYPAGAVVRCTFTEIPQARQTRSVILSKPFWMFGCEMGANDAGVVMGNEAVFTREPYESRGLTGMDLMRLALERSSSAQEAVRTIIDLMGEHGQHASGGYQHAFSYHNAFLVADAREAFVLETAGRYWALEQVRDVRSISNGLSIGQEWDDAAPGLVEHAVERGWCKGRSDFHFARCYRDPIITTFSASRQRASCTLRRLREAQERLTPAIMAEALRDHGLAKPASDWTPAQGLFMSVCAHGSWGPIRGGGAQTTGSMIAQVKADSLPLLWLTGTAAPCTSVFRPACFEAGERLAEIFGPEPGAQFDPTNRWWRHERLHRAVLIDYRRRLGSYYAERNALEWGIFAGFEAIADRAGFCELGFQKADAAEESWWERVRQMRAPRRMQPLYRSFWRRQNRSAGLKRA